MDWRAGFIGHVAYQTGRRLTAIRTLPKQKGWISLHDSYAVLHFPGETDKARNTGQAIITGHALQLSRKAARQWTAPSMEEAQGWLRTAEEASGVPHIARRSWHGLKRLYATLARGHLGRERQSGTTGQTLDSIYVQDEIAPKLELARVLEGRLAGQLS